MHNGKIPVAREALNRSVREGSKNLDIILRVWKGWDQGHMTYEENYECILSLLIVTLFQMKKMLQ